MHTKDLSARKTPSQYRSIEKVRKILDGAIEVLVEDGLLALTTNSVAEMSGVTVGSIYQYFPNKEAILLVLYREWLDEAFQTYREYADAHSEISDPADYFEGLFMAYCDASGERDHKLSSELVNALMTNPQLRAMDEEYSINIVQFLHQDRIRLGVDQPGSTTEQTRIGLDIVVALLDVVSRADRAARPSYIERTRKLVRLSLS